MINPKVPETADIRQIAEASAPGVFPPMSLLLEESEVTPPRGKHMHPSKLFMASDEAKVIELAIRLIPLIKREDIVSTRSCDALFDDRHSPAITALDRVSTRMYRRLARWTRRLAKTHAPTLRAAAMKAGVLIELRVGGHRENELCDALAVSLASDISRLAVAAACNPMLSEGPPDHRAVDAYHQFLHLELRYLEAERGIKGGVPWNTAANSFHDTAHLPGSTPSSRAERVLIALGIDWTSEDHRDDQGRPFSDAAVARVA